MCHSELGPRNRLPTLHAFCCFQKNTAKVCGLVSLLQVQDSEDSGCLTLCPVQDEPVLEVLMCEMQYGVVNIFPVEVLPSPGYAHLRILGQLPGEVEGEGDLDGAALDPREVCWLVEPIGIFSAGSC